MKSLIAIFLMMTPLMSEAAHYACATYDSRYKDSLDWSDEKDGPTKHLYLDVRDNDTLEITGLSVELNGMRIGDPTYTRGNYVKDQKVGGQFLMYSSRNPINRNANDDLIAIIYISPGLKRGERSGYLSVTSLQRGRTIATTGTFNCHYF